MIGCRALENEEIDQIKEYFEKVIKDEIADKTDLQTRNKTLMFFGFYSGFRISEILSLKIEDVYKYGKITDSCYLKRENTKKKVCGRNGVINVNCKELLEEYFDHYNLKDKPLDTPLFFSKKGGALCVRQCQKLYKDVFNACELDGKLSTHTCRKTFAKKIYAAVDRNVVDLQAAMGHKNLSSTQSYISFDNKKVQGALSSLEY